MTRQATLHECRCWLSMKVWINTGAGCGSCLQLHALAACQVKHSVLAVGASRPCQLRSPLLLCSEAPKQPVTWC